MEVVLSSETLAGLPKYQTTRCDIPDCSQCLPTFPQTVTCVLEELVTASAVGRDMRTAMQPLSTNFMTVSFPTISNFPVSFYHSTSFCLSNACLLVAQQRRGKRQCACAAKSCIHFSATSTLTEAISVPPIQHSVLQMGRIHGRSQVSLSATTPRRLQL